MTLGFQHHRSISWTDFASIHSDVNEQVWVWDNDGAEYYYDKQDWVRLRIEVEEWHDLSPVAPGDREAVANAERKSPYSITVSGVERQSRSAMAWS